MRVKKIIFGLAAFFFLSVSAFAQAWPTTDEFMGRVRAEMNLDQDQLAQVQLIIEENTAKRLEVRPQMAQGLTEAQEEPIDTELYTKLSQVLTPDQMTIWGRILNSMLQNTNGTQSGR